MKQTPSDVQLKILGFIAERIQQDEFPPTIREIQQHCDFRSPRAISFHLDKLLLQGYIERPGSGRARSIRLTQKAQQTIAVAFPDQFPRQASPIPLLGNIQAGFPSLEEAWLQSEETFDEQLTPYANGRHFALRVSGDSMIDAHILEGDIVIAEQRQAEPDEIVVALIDGEVTLKRLRQKHGGYYLQAENSNYPDLEPVNEMNIQGVVVGVHRTL